MKFAGLAGGIGSGKSTVAARLVERGAVVLDVDQISREVQQPGQPVYRAMVARWGDAIVGPDGALDRQAVAHRVFADHDELAALMAITTPAIEASIYARVAAHHDTDRVVVLEAALLARNPRLYGIAGLIVVDVPEELAIRRLVTGRGMLERDARARLANQPPREARLQAADFVIDNSGGLEALDEQVEAAWAWLGSLPDGRLEARPSPAGPSPPATGAG
ncbi:MAG TPA: dephospho-CoA kinase [Acidimicrobiales bacterium]|nr:dephospho-CoA kinase [Acidimicrobiales bacterium]